MKKNNYKNLRMVYSNFEEIAKHYARFLNRNGLSTVCMTFEGAADEPILFVCVNSKKYGKMCQKARFSDEDEHMRILLGELAGDYMEGIIMDATMEFDDDE